MVLWLGYRMLSRLLYRGYRRYEKWEIHELYPQYKRTLRRYQWLSIGIAVFLLLGWLGLVAYMPDPRLAHAGGVIYGLLLLVDATFAWVTGIRSIEPRFIIEEQRTWRSKLQLAIAAACLAVPAVLLATSIG